MYKLMAVALILLLAGCNSGALQSPGIKQVNQKITLTVFAAASLVDAFSQIGTQFQNEHPDASLSFNFAGSQQLAQQIAQGAPADVFVSADDRNMQAAVQTGRASQADVRTLCSNRLVVVYPSNNPARLSKLQDLARPGLRIVLAAEQVPAGKYALTFLDKASQQPAFGATYKADVLKNVVSYEENVRAVFSKVALGEADAGIVYATDASGPNQAKTGLLDIPDELNVQADYLVAPLNDSAHQALAKEFIQYLLSPAGQAILKENGFIPHS